ncbi:hypothetical protein [Cohnella sp.]|uniref:hypothetical protein n=1 Tax=Cohnella sp. TaxID=1883426 RepID=UPI0035629721
MSASMQNRSREARNSTSNWSAGIALLFIAGGRFYKKLRKGLNVDKAGCVDNVSRLCFYFL